MHDFLNGINNFSGLLTFLTFIAASLWFVFGLKARIIDVKDTALDIKEDYTAYKVEHTEQTRQIKTISYEIRDKINEQNIHQEYMRKISENSTDAITTMNSLLSQLSKTLEDINDKINNGGLLK